MVLRVAGSKTVGGSITNVANKDHWHSIVTELCTTVSNSVESAATPDLKHVDPDGLASPDSKRDSSRECCMRRLVLDKDKGKEFLCTEGFGCLSLIEQ